MNNWENTVITNKGLALLAKLIEGYPLRITRGYSGTGYVTPGVLQNLTDVQGKVQPVNFRPVSYPEPGKCALKCYLTNDSLGSGYAANQIGIYARDPNEGEILFIISQAERGKGTDIPSNTEMPGYTSEWNFTFKYGQAGSVSVTVDPTGTVSREEMEEFIDTEIQSISTAEIDSVFPEEKT